MKLLERVRQVLARPQPPESVAADEEPAVLEMDFPACLAREFPEEFPAAQEATAQVLAAIKGVDLEPLARNSPGLRGYAWSVYLTASLSRIVRAARALRQHAAPGAHLLDYGSYFGNFSLTLARMGYRVDAAD